MDPTRRQLLRYPLGLGASFAVAGLLPGCGGGNEAEATVETEALVPDAEAQAARPDSSYANVKSAPFHAKGDGVSDDTAALQAAVDASARVYLPAGTYRVGSLRLRDRTVLLGDGNSSVIQQSSAAHLLTAESASPTAFVEGIRLRKLQLRGQVTTLGFREHTHLLAVNGVRDLRIADCLFSGFRGDGIYLGGMSSSGGTPRHNQATTIIRCEFDGANGDNRNAITVIDGDQVLIQDNRFHDCTRPDMPGAVDIEPNDNDFHIVRGITVTGNDFKNIGGNVGVVAVVLAGHHYTSPPGDFEVSHNTIDTCSAYGFAFVNHPAGGVPADAPGHATRVLSNTVLNARSGFGLTGAVGVTLEDNRFTDRNGSYIGYVGNDLRCRDITLSRNRFIHCGSVGRIGLQAFTVDRLLLQGNTFTDCGNGLAASYALDFKSGSSSQVSLLDNTFEAPTGQTLVAIQKEAGHSFSPAGNRFSGNILNGLPNHFEWT